MLQRDYSLWGMAAHGPLALIAAGASAIGTAISAAGTIAGGQAAKSAADYRAQQYNLQAQTSTAEGQRQMMEEQRKGALVGSTLQARAAASGGSATDPTVLKLGSDIAGRTEYGALSDLFQGQDRSAGLYDEANAAKASGDAAVTGSYFGAAGTVASGVGSMFSTLGQRGWYGLGNSGSSTPGGGPNVGNGFGPYRLPGAYG